MLEKYLRTNMNRVNFTHRWKEKGFGMVFSIDRANPPWNCLQISHYPNDRQGCFVAFVWFSRVNQLQVSQ